ncbi:MAG: 3-phosphoglycerate dehydrogenase family protein [Clostridiales bacterium]|nr:3-phosphoglycerate dehydrogenase family protein [Clostridiales bacterium]
MKVKLLNKIDKKGLAELGNGYTVGEDIADADAYLVRSASLLDAEFPASLRAIARAGAGVNNIPLDRCAEQGIVVFNTPGANANGVKELAIASLFIASRRITEGIAWANTLTGEVGKQVEKGKSAFAGPEISGKTLGVIGLGAIGGIVANAAASLGMKVVGCDPYITVNAAWSLSRDVSKADSYDELFPLCDYITLHVPSLPSTKGMINAESIAKMRDGVRIINLSRGDIVNSDDIIAAVKSGKVARYVTDFPDEKLLGIDNIICIPHLGASTPESEENCAIMAARELTDFLENGNIHNSVNYPEISMPRISAHRIIVLHENIPNMLAQVSSAISASGVNIDHMVSSSKNTSAAALFDSDNEFSADVIASISAVSGVRKAILLS